MNLTYVLGAGASANALPIVKDMDNRIEIFIDHLKKFIHLDSDEENQLQSLSTEIRKHYTIDTYAKKLFLKGRHAEDELLKLYNFMGAYFIYEQLRKDWENDDISKYLFEKRNNYFDDKERMIPYNLIINSLDYRYDSFYAALLKSDEKGNTYLPPNINIISWNYDCQLEISYMNFTEGTTLDEVQKELNVYPTPSGNRLRGGSSVIKINGTAGFYGDGKPYSDLFDYRKHTLNRQSMGILKDIIFQKREKYKNSIYFAWNDDEITKEARNYAKQIIGATDVLVILGYSFPYFNRDVDRDIFSRLENKVEGIYIQTTADSAESIKSRSIGVNERFRYSKSFTELDQFLIPNELI